MANSLPAIRAMTVVKNRIINLIIFTRPIILHNKHIACQWDEQLCANIAYLWDS